MILKKKNIFFDEINVQNKYSFNFLNAMKTDYSGWMAFKPFLFCCQKIFILIAFKTII